MSWIRDGRYSAHAARICRSDGHRLEGDRCAVRIRLDSGDTSPHVTGTRLVGVPVGAMEADPPARRAEQRETCGRGHADWRVTASGQRRCHTCRLDSQRRSRLTFGRTWKG